MVERFTFMCSIICVSILISVPVSTNGTKKQQDKSKSTIGMHILKNGVLSRTNFPSVGTEFTEVATLLTAPNLPRKKKLKFAPPNPPKRKRQKVKSDLNLAGDKLRQDPATPPQLGDLLALSPLALLAVQAPLVYVLFAFVISNLALISVGRAELTRNLENTEEVLHNINEFQPPARKLNSTSDEETSEEDESASSENEILHKEGFPVEDIGNYPRRGIVLLCVALLIYGALQVGILPALFVGMLTYYLFYYFGNRRFGITSRNSASKLKSLKKFERSGNQILNLIHTYKPL